MYSRSLGDRVKRWIFFVMSGTSPLFTFLPLANHILEFLIPAAYGLLNPHTTPAGIKWGINDCNRPHSLQPCRAEGTRLEKRKGEGGCERKGWGRMGEGFG